MKFKGQVRKSGTSFVVTIPKRYVTDGLITINKEYVVELLGEAVVEDKAL